MKSFFWCVSLFTCWGLCFLAGCERQVASRVKSSDSSQQVTKKDVVEVDGSDVGSKPESNDVITSLPNEIDEESSGQSEEDLSSQKELEHEDAFQTPRTESVNDVGASDIPSSRTKPVSLTTKSEKPLDSKSDIDSPTHRQFKTLQPTIDGKPVRLNTFCVAVDGRILAACGGKQSIPVMSEAGGYVIEEIDEPACVVVFDSSGAQIEQWDLEFRPTAITVSPQGNVFVGGEGKLAQLSADGDLLASGDSPNLEDIEIFKERAIKQAKEQAAQFGDMFKTQIESIEKRITKLAEIEEADRSRIQNAQLKAYRKQLEMYESLADSQMDALNPDAILQQALKITSLAASEEDIFLVCQSLEGSGFSIWRTDHAFGGSREVLDGVRGCCGQMDIQCCEGKLVIAENSAFRVAIHDRDGQEINSFGQRDRTSKSGFGSCCNPMNVLPMADGSLLTAESSIGHIKRFDQAGNLVSYIGRARVGGGCKHCALGFDPETDQYYMMHEDENKICVLANADSLPDLSEEEASIAKIRTEFDGRFLGTWEFETGDGVDGKDDSTDEEFGVSIPTIDEMLFSKMTFNLDGSLEVEGGQYASIDYQWTWEAGSAGEDKLTIQVYGDQVSLMPMTFNFGAENEAHVEVSGMGGNTMVPAKRTHNCDGKPCGEKCDEEETVALK